MEDFARALSEDPTLLERLRKQTELRTFKEKYNTERATPLKCPVCAVFYQYPGSLWINKDNPIEFVCRKCHFQFRLECHTVPNEKLIEDLRKAAKGELTSISWFEQKEVKENGPQD